MIYPLWAFTDGTTLVITRGSTEDVAMTQVMRTTPAFRKGVTIYPTVLPLYAAQLYNSNHAPGWLHRCPVYEMRLMNKTAQASPLLNTAMSRLQQRSDVNDKIRQNSA